MNVLLIGGGGREHALAWKLKQSPLLGTLYCAPGNAGIADVAECLPLDVSDHAAVARFCKENGIGLVIIGPEAPLVAGLTDDLEAQGIKVFGPSKAAAQLEGSKGFTKDLCARAGIPTAAYARFSDAPAAKAYVATQKLPIVIKADGLAAGKGVTIAETKSRGRRRDRRLLLGCIRCRWRRGGDRGVPARRGSELLRPGRRQRRRCRSPRRRTTSAPSTATRGPTPAAWAPTLRRRS